MRSRFGSFGKRGKALASFLFDHLLKKDTEKVKVLPKAGANRKKIWLASLVVVLVTIVFLSVHQVSAAFDPSQTSKMIMNWAIAGIAKLIVWIAEALGLVLIFLIELLINIVQYNNFVKATPVQIGWPLIRDTVNMFFIVVVLVSAFATIIGYPKEFRYREVLPKLLLMAVLINFSKTLIGLMIDFSQVVLLTFVNGFKQAAGGNFVQALGIAKIMRLTDTTGTIEETPTGDIKISLDGAGEASPWSLLNIVVSAVFAIWIISISITLILIMLIFFLGRIIMLWFLLITSPIAFFAWSLPGSLKKALSSFTDEWWSRLSNALIGGPTMAFFLWLSLAMAQRQSDLIGPGGLYNPDAASTEVTQMQTQTKQDQFIWPTEFGDPRIFATFIIMVAFMLLGVQVSVKFAGSVAPGSEKILGFLKSGGAAGIGVAGIMAAGKLAGKATATTARTTGRVALGGAKLAGKGAVFAGKEFEARTGMVAGMAKDFQKTSMFALAPTSMQKKITGVAATTKKATQAKAEQFKEIGSTMSPVEYGEFLQKQEEVMKLNPYGKVADLGGVQLAQAQLGLSSVYQDAYNEKMKTVAAQQLPPDATEEQKSARARELTDAHIAERLDSAEKYARDNNDDELLKKVKEKREKKPNLVSQGSKIVDQARKDAPDTQSERKFQPETFMNGTYALNYAFAKGWVDENGQLVAGAEDENEYKNFMVGKQGQYMKAHFEYARTDAGKKQAKQLITGKNDSGVVLDDKQLAASNYNINVSKDGEEYHIVQNQNFNAAALGLDGVPLMTKGRFDRTTKDPDLILRRADDKTKAQINTNVGSLGKVLDENGMVRDARVSDFGKEIASSKVAEKLGMNLAQLQKEREFNADDSLIIEHRAEIAQEFLQQDISTTALFGHDQKSGSFADTEGRKAFEKTTEDIISAIMDDKDYSQKTISTLASLAKQVGSKGEAFEILQKQISKLNQNDLASVARAADATPEHKKFITKLTKLMSSQAKIDIDQGKIGTPAMQFIEKMRKPPSSADHAEYRDYSDVRKMLY